MVSIPTSQLDETEWVRGGGPGESRTPDKRFRKNSALF
jgi:hypothetical protein